MKKTIDPGTYNKKQKEYTTLIEKLYKDFPDGIMLPAEYAFFMQFDLTRFLIRLARYKFVYRMISSKDRVLEVGCGSGLGSIYLSQKCKSVTGIDIKSTEIEEAKKLSKRNNVAFYQEDLFCLDVKKTYDVVVALDVIEHMDKSEGSNFVRTMGSHLVRNGMLVIGTPSVYSYPYQGKLSKASHVKCYDQTELKEMLHRNFHRVLSFSMNDEMVHTGDSKMAWYYFMLGFYKK